MAARAGGRRRRAAASPSPRGEHVLILNAPTSSEQCPRGRSVNAFIALVQADDEDPAPTQSAIKRATGPLMQGNFFSDLPAWGGPTR